MFLFLLSLLFSIVLFLFYYTIRSFYIYNIYIYYKLLSIYIYYCLTSALFFKYTREMIYVAIAILLFCALFAPVANVSKPTLQAIPTSVKRIGEAAGRYHITSTYGLFRRFEPIFHFRPFSPSSNSFSVYISSDTCRDRGKDREICIE